MSIPGGWKIPAVVLVGFATSIGAYAVTRPDPAPPAPTAVSSMSEYPAAQFTLAEGSGKGLVEAYCTACHSLAPIVHHGGFTTDQWASEVTKMRESYGAPIDDATAAQITSYLQAHYSAPLDPPPAGTSREVWAQPTSTGATGQ